MGAAKGGDMAQERAKEAEKKAKELEAEEERKTMQREKADMRREARGGGGFKAFLRVLGENDNELDANL